MKYLKRFEAREMNHEHIDLCNQIIRTAFAELLDSNDVDIWKVSEEYDWDETWGESIKVHIDLPEGYYNPEGGYEIEFRNYLSNVNKVNELLEDIDVALKRLDDKGLTPAFHYENDCIELIFVIEDPYK
jgi:hypothetical protein